MLELDKIYNIDCFVGFKQLEDNSVDYVFTSPPYNRKRNDKYTLYDDKIVDYLSFLRTTIDESMRVSRRQVFINIQSTFYNKKDVYKIIGDYAEKIQQIII